MDKQLVVAETRRWISSMVIGLNLCPFAGTVFNADTIRYVVTETREPKTLLDQLAGELETLASSPVAQIATTLLIHPNVLVEFLDYNEFLDRCEGLIAQLGLEGIIQIASFHPAYRFADTESDAVENYTNRSPYPMLHLLREESIAQVAGDPSERLVIPKRNIETLRSLGKAKVLEKLQAIRDGRE